MVDPPEQPLHPLVRGSHRLSHVRAGEVVQPVETGFKAGETLLLSCSEEQ